MGGSSQITGWNYRLAWHDGLAKGPWDALTEFRGADKTAWRGRVESNTTITVSAPMLWGGDKDQGGVDGRLSVMFGEADQLPNAYLVSVFGPKTAAHRGMMTVAWEGGIWGANNPFQQKRSYRGERTYAGWDDGDCWYAATVRVPIEGDFSSGGSTVERPDGYRWVFRMAGTNSMSASTDGKDWIEEDFIAAPYDNAVSVALVGNDLLFAHASGETKYRNWATSDAYSTGPNIGAVSGLSPALAVIEGRVFAARGEYGYSYTDDITDPWTQVSGTTSAITGNDHHIIKHAGGWASLKRSVDKGETFGPTLASDPSPPPVFFSYRAMGASADEIAVGGGYTGGGPFIWVSSDGFLTKTVSALPAGLGECGVAGLIHIDQDEWIAFLSFSSGSFGPIAILRSTDNCISFTGISLGKDATIFSAGINRKTGQVVAVMGTDDGIELYETDDRQAWTLREYDAPIDPEEVFCIVPYSGYGLPGQASGRIAKNPAHIILEMHTQRHTGRQPRDSVNLEHLTTQADWFYSRGFGLCTVRNPKETSPREFIKRIEQVAGCSFTKSLADGLWYVDVANGIYDLESLPVITDDDVLKFKETASVSDNVVNSVSVKYFDPERNENVITPPVKAMGLIAQFGEIHQTFEYLEIPIGRIALEVAMRELLARITPTRAFELDCRPTIHELRRNQYVRLQLPKRGIVDMVCLVAEIPTSGKLKSGAFQISLTQDIYSLPTTVYEVELGEDTSPPATPAEIADQRVFEAPYIDVVANMPAADFAALPADAGYVVGAAVDPGRMRDFTMMVAPDGGAYDDVGDGQFCPSCTSAGLVEPGLQDGIGFTNPSRMASVQVGDLGWWDGELVRVDAKDLSTNMLDLGRGCGDTIPRRHEADSRIFFYQSTAAFDRTQHIAGETLDVKLLTNSYTERQDITTAQVVDVTMAERIARPYNNGRLEINGVSIFAIGTSTPGGGGGGGPGGGGPTAPPAQSPGGGPASPVPGPNGGFPDDAPFPIPSPTVFGSDVIGDGDFTDPNSLAGWRDRLGNPLASDWEVTAGKAQFTGSAGTAYGYAWRMSISPQPFPRYSITVTAKVQTTGGQTARVGVAWGTNTSIEPGSDVPNYIEADPAASHLTETTVSYTWELQRQAEFITANLYYGHVNFMPVVQFTELDGAPEIGTVDDARMVIAEVPVPTTTITLDHLDFDTGLADWDLWPSPTNPYAATVAAAGGELSMTPTHELAKFANAYCVAPIDAAVADAVGKYIVIEAEVWCDDPSVDLRGRTTGGAHMYLAPNTVTDGYGKNAVYVAQRGDWTLRRWWYRIKTVPSGSLLSYNVCAQMMCALGYSVKVRNITTAITDSVMD